MEDIEQLQERIGYTFGDRGILLRSLTHTSYGHEFLPEEPLALRNNERLEFLGDAILDLIISDILLETYPNATEGRLTKMRAAIVNEKTLADVGRHIGLQRYLRLGKGEKLTGGATKPSIVSSGFEALIAAIYLDGGYHAVYPVVRHLFSSFFEQGRELMNFYDHKTQLQELVQARWRVTPSYHLEATHGPDHAKTFEIEVRMKGETMARAQGASKKEAEQNAAEAAIRAFLSVDQ